MSHASKENKKLRREVEILKAQLKTTSKTEKTPIPTSNSKTTQKAANSSANDYLNIEDKYIKQDILKSVVISGIIFVAIFTIWIIQG